MKKIIFLLMMAVIGIVLSAFLFYTYSVNRKQYFSLLFEVDDMGRPMIQNSMSMSTIHSKNSSSMINPYATPNQMNPSSRTSSTRNILPSIVSKQGSIKQGPIYEKPSSR